MKFDLLILKKNNLLFFEFFFFFFNTKNFYIFSIFSYFFIYRKNYFYLKKFNSFLYKSANLIKKKFNLFFQPISKNDNYSSQNNKKIDTKVFFHSERPINYFATGELNKNSNSIIFYKNKINFLIYKFFFLFNYSFVNLTFLSNTSYAIYHFKIDGYSINILNLKYFFNRWVVSYDFIFNLNYFEFNKLYLANPLFKVQTFALNWHYNKWSFNLWKYFTSFFLLRHPSYNRKIFFFFSKLKKHKINYFIVADSLFHLKNIFYLKKNFFFIISLISTNRSIRYIDFPIFAFFDNYLLQLFFLKFLIFVSKQSLFLSFTSYKNIWFQLNYNKLNHFKN